MLRQDTRIYVARKLNGARCRCPACGEHFNSVSTFDRHRVGAYTARRCLTVAEMTARGWNLNAGGFWMTPNHRRLAFAYRRISGDRHDPRLPQGSHEWRPAMRGAP